MLGFLRRPFPAEILEEDRVVAIVERKFCAPEINPGRHDIQLRRSGCSDRAAHPGGPGGVTRLGRSFFQGGAAGSGLCTLVNTEVACIR